MKDHTPEIRKGIDYFDFRPFDSNYPDTNFYNLNVCDYDVFLTNEDEVKTHLKQLKESIEEAGIYRKKYSAILSLTSDILYKGSIAKYSPALHFVDMVSL